MSSLSQLIYGNTTTNNNDLQSQSQTPSTSEQPVPPPTTTSPRRFTNPILRSSYNYDPIEAHYSSAPPLPLPPPPTTTTTSPTQKQSRSKTTRQRYDYQRNETDREFYSTDDFYSTDATSNTGTTHTTATSHRSSGRPPRRKKRRKQRKRIEGTVLSYVECDEGDDGSDCEETSQEREERVDRTKRRYRFRNSKRYDLVEEEDWGGAVEFVVRKQMEEDNYAGIKLDDDDDNNDDNGGGGGTNGTGSNTITGEEHGGTTRADTTHRHVLGSLIDRVEEQDAAIVEAKRLKMEEDERADPMFFLKEGHAAPKENNLKYSFRERSHIKLEEVSDAENAVAVLLPPTTPSSTTLALAPSSSSNKLPNQENSESSMVLIHPRLPRPRKIPASTSVPYNNPFRNLRRRRDTFYYLPYTRSDGPSDVLRRPNTAADLPGWLVGKTTPVSDYLTIYGGKHRPSRGRNTLKKRVAERFHCRSVGLLATRLLMACTTGVGLRSNGRDGIVHGGGIGTGVSSGTVRRAIEWLHRPNRLFSRTYYVLVRTGEIASDRAMYDEIQTLKSLSLRTSSSGGGGGSSSGSALRNDDDDDDERRLLRRCLLSVEDPEGAPPGGGGEYSVDMVCAATERRRKILRKVVMGRTERGNSGNYTTGAGANTKKEEGGNGGDDTKTKTDQWSRTKTQASWAGSFAAIHALRVKSLRELPRDQRYSAVRHLSDIDPAAILLTFGSMLTASSIERSRLVTATVTATATINNSNSGSNNYNNDRSSIEQIHGTILSYLDTAIQTIWYTGSDDRRLVVQMQGEIMNGPLALCMLTKQSYLANGGAVGVKHIDAVGGGRRSRRLSDSDEDIVFGGGSRRGGNRNNSNSSNTDNNNDDDERSVPAAVNLTEVAKELAEFGNPFEGDYRVESFEEISVTTAIAMIAAVFPPYAAEILSRPFVDGGGSGGGGGRKWEEEIRSPFDALRLALESTERHGHISRPTNTISTSLLDQSSFSYNVSDTTLIQTLDTASTIFQRLLDRHTTASITTNHDTATVKNQTTCFTETDDAVYLNHLSWFTAIRVSILLIGSGITIGEGPALAAPPSHVYEDYHGGGGGGGRARRAEYAEQRALASRAVRDLMRLRNRRVDGGIPGERPSCHAVSIISFLEWKEAVYLLAFRPLLNGRCESICRSIRTMHASHVLHWACSEGTVFALRNLRSLVGNGREGEGIKVSRGAMARLLALIVERDNGGSLLEGWWDLACELGPLGRSVERGCKRSKKKKKTKYCERGKSCIECRRLQKSHRHRINHRKIERQKTSKTWWGRFRAEWWDYTYFEFPASLRLKKPLPWNTAYELQRIILTSTDDDVGDIDEHAKGGIKWKEEGPIVDLSWMWSVEASEMDEEDHRNDDDSEWSDTGSICATRKSFDIYLPERPVTCVNIQTRTNSRFEDMKEVDGKIGENDYLVRMIASKAFVVCHLYNTCHPFVGEAVWWLTKRWWFYYYCQESTTQTSIKPEKRKLDSNDKSYRSSNLEFKMLKWLSHNGLNVIAIVNEYQKSVELCKENETPLKTDDYSNYCFLELL